MFGFLFLHGLLVRREEFPAVLAQIDPAWRGRIRLVAHEPFPENHIEVVRIDAMRFAIEGQYG